MGIFKTGNLSFSQNDTTVVLLAKTYIKDSLTPYTTTSADAMSFPFLGKAIHIFAKWFKNPLSGARKMDKGKI